MHIRRSAPLALAFSLPLVACNVSDKDIEPSATAQELSFFATADSKTALRMAEELSFKHLYEVDPALIEGVDGVWAKRVKIDSMGEAHTRMLQTHEGYEVFGAQAIVHLDRAGSFKGMTDGFVRNINVDTTAAKLTDLEALDIAVDSTGGWDKITGTPQVDKMIARIGDVDHLTYRVQIDQFESDVDPAQPVVFVSAVDGSVVNSYDNLKYARNRRTHSANNGTSLPGTLVLSETSNPSNDAIVNQAHENARITYDYYFARHGRDSFNGSGATITSTVHYSRNYVNAFWNGTQMVYGDGDGQTASALTVLDVVAHELTHAVTDYESDLIYQNESGALNEAMSDIFGAAVEAYRDGGVNDNTWKIGEECWTPNTPGDALRYMNRPADAGDYDYYPERYTGPQDNGGVHWNSGIANLAFYLLSQGGTHPRNKTNVVVTGIGIEKAAAIFYRANATYLTPTSNFQGAREATAKSATDLYGANSNELTQVHRAWDAVGVPGGASQPPTGGELENGASVGNLSATSGNWIHFYIEVPDNATDFNVSISGGSGDADLYVRRGSQPTTTAYDCRPYKTGNSETCTFAAPAAGTWYISIRAYSSFSGVTLTASFTAQGGSGYPGLELNQTGLSGSQGSWLDYTLTVPADATSLVIQIAGGSGDADLYVRKGALPTTSTYDCRPYKSGNNESCTFNSSLGGTWYISIRGYSAYSGLTLTGDYDK